MRLDGSRARIYYASSGSHLGVSLNVRAPDVKRIHQRLFLPPTIVSLPIILSLKAPASATSQRPRQPPSQPRPLRDCLLQFKLKGGLLLLESDSACSSFAFLSSANWLANSTPWKQSEARNPSSPTQTFSPALTSLLLAPPRAGAVRPLAVVGPPTHGPLNLKAGDLVIRLVTPST